MASPLKARFTLVACSALALAALRCGGKTFSAQGHAGSGGALAGSRGDDAGNAGSTPGGQGGRAAGSGGSAGTPAQGGRGGAGAGGAAGGGREAGGEGGDDRTGGSGESGAGGERHCDDDSPCGRGSYCTPQSVCRACTDISTVPDLANVRFKTPEPLSIVNAAAGDFVLRMPRAFGSGNALLYVRDFFGGELWLTGDPERDVGAPLASPINESTRIEGSPVWFESATGDLDAYNLVFATATGAGAPAELYGAALKPNGTANSITRLPAPFNPQEPLSHSAYSMAVSRDRAWWMVNRDLMLAIEFLTAPLDQSGPPSVVPLRHDENCSVAEFDVTAWATPDGRLLFVSALERDAECKAPEGDPHDVVMFKLDEAGQTLGFGVPVAGVSRPNTHEIDGSLSADMCTMYFVTHENDKLRLMKAERER
jgi:hypothetical protein